MHFPKAEMLKQLQGLKQFEMLKQLQIGESTSQQMVGHCNRKMR